MAVPVLTCLLVGCGGAAWDASDTAAVTVAARVEGRQLDACGDVDSGACTPEFAHATAALAYCASARELIVHGAPVPEAGIKCSP